MIPGAKTLLLAIRCDGLRQRGVGHLVRQLALIEETIGRGHRVWLVGDIDVPWAVEAVAGMGIDWSPAMPDQEFIDECRARGVDAVMIDGYTFSADLGRGLGSAGMPVATMVDDDFGAHQVADLYVDQNLGARPGTAPGTWLVGTDYVLLRDSVRGRRTQHRDPAPDTLRVLVVFGGTDPFEGAPVATELLLDTRLPLQVVAIAATDALADQLRGLEVGPGQQLEVLPPHPDLPGLAISCDAAVSAAGSSTWEFAALGIPTALVCVVDNQAEGYREATADLAVGLGMLEDLRSTTGARTEARVRLHDLLADPAELDRRAWLARRLVDGDGRVRVAEAVEDLAGLSG